MVGTNGFPDALEVVDERSDGLSVDRVFEEQVADFWGKSPGVLLVAGAEVGGEPSEADVMEPRADEQNVLLFRIETADLSHLLAEAHNGFCLCAEMWVKEGENAVAEFQRAIKGMVERDFGAVELLSLVFELLHLLFEARVGGGQFLIEKLGLAFQLGLGVDEFVSLDRVLHGSQHFGSHPRFGNETEEFAPVYCIDEGFEGSYACDQNARGFGLYDGDLTEKLGAHHRRHLLVRNHHGELSLASERQSLFWVGGDHHIKAGVAESDPEDLEDHGIIVYDQYGVARARHETLRGG